MRLLAAIVSALLLPACVCGWLYNSPWPEPVEPVRVVTDDGWSLDLRHVPRSAGPTRARPVIVLHGIVANGRNMDFDEHHSIARSLARDGFDVWVPSLRGVGDSEKRDGDDPGYGFDAHVLHDLPAIIGEVQRRTGSAEVDFVGHSMGGLVLYAHLARGGGGIGRAVTLGSPVRLHWTGLVEQVVGSVTGLATLTTFPLRAATLTTLPVQGAWSGPVERMLTTPDNTRPDVWRRFLSVSVDDIPQRLLEQFAGWVEHKRFASRDGSVDYLAGLSNVHVPTLVVAGKVDGMAPPWSVRPAFDRLGSEEKQWVVLGEASGCVADYSHMDMLLGERADREVFPRVAAFLSQEARR